MIFTFTEFLGLAEQDVFNQIESELRYVGYKIFGGTDDGERVIVRFGNEEELGYSVDYPIKCLVIRPLMQKFAEDLTHRDFLGALMNLGIKREKLGDIIIHENEGYLFCLEQIADYIVDNLTRVKHTSVTVEIENNSEKISHLYKEPLFEQKILIIPQL